MILWAVILSMDIVLGNVDLTSRGSGDMFCSSYDGVDIVGDGKMDDIGEEHHMGPKCCPYLQNPLWSVLGSLGWTKWIWKWLLLTIMASISGEGVCHNTHPNDCIDKIPLGKNDVGVVIVESIVHAKVNPLQRFLLRTWPPRNTMLEGVSLHDHLIHHMQIEEDLWANLQFMF